MNSNGRVSIGRLAVVGTALLSILIILALVFPMVSGIPGFLSVKYASANPDWLSGWDYRIKLTTNSTKIDSDLSHFPITVFLNENNGDTAKVFDEVGLNYKKIAIADDSATPVQYYVEIEKWTDHTKSDDNPVLPGDGDDTWDYDKSYVSVVYNSGWAEASRYRMWYGAADTSDDWCTCYAYSSDGISWTRPNLGLYSYGGSTNNNIVLEPEALLSDAIYDADTGKYYIVVGVDSSSSCVKIYQSSSPDSGFSLVKTLSVGPTGLNEHKHGMGIVKKPDGKWLVYTQYRDGSYYRDIGLYSSNTTDITGDWTDEGVVITNNGSTEQRYSIDVWLEDGTYQAAVLDYNATTELSSFSRWESDDGESWTELWDWFGPGASGEWDDGFLEPGKLVDLGVNGWRYYYSGFQEVHWVLPRKSGIGFIEKEADGILHFGKTGETLPSGSDKDYYLYYDGDHDDNTTYVGDTPGASPATNVWASAYKVVYHCNDASGGLADSTSNGNNATEGGGPTYQQIGKVGYGVELGDEVVPQTEDFEWGSDTDPLDDSGGDFTWTISAGGSSKAEIDTGQHHSGTRSARLYRDGTNNPSASFSHSPMASEETWAMWLRKDETSQMVMYHGDGTKCICFNLEANEDLIYYDGTIHDTGKDVVVGQWHLLEIKNVDWDAGTYDIYLDEEIAKSGATMRTYSGSNGVMQWSNYAGTSECWIDDITVDVTQSDYFTAPITPSGFSAMTVTMLAALDVIDGSDATPLVPMFFNSAYQQPPPSRDGIRLEYGDTDSIVNRAQIAMDDTQSGYAFVTHENDGWTVGVFRQIGFTHDGAKGTILYSNGANVTSGSSTSDFDYAGLDNLTYIGCRQGTTLDSHLDGVLDEIRIADGEMSAAWMKATYNSLFDSLLTYGSEEEPTPEITNTPNSNDFGILEVNTTGNTVINYFTIENTGNCGVDVVIYGTDAAGGGDTWTLSDTATPGENIYGLYAGLDDDDDTFDVIVRKTETYNTLVSDLAENATQDWGLKIYMPTALSGYDCNNMTATITLVASEAS